MSEDTRRYLIQSPAGRLYVTATDLLLRALVRRGGDSPGATPVRRLLLGVGGHIGDAIIATAALPWIRENLPDTEVGIVASSAARAVFEGHPDIRWFHPRDHWKLDRSSAPVARKASRSFASGRLARREISAIGYDAAVDFYPFYPNMAVLFWRAGIPRRIGFSSGGGGPALTVPVEWSESRVHMAAYHRSLLSKLATGTDLPLRYDLPPIDPATERRGNDILREHALTPRGYAVLHPGSGDSRKSWPVENWVNLAQRLTATGRRVVLTGAGVRDADLTGRIHAQARSSINLCGQTDLGLLRLLLRDCSHAVVIDSAAAHLAGAEHTRSVVIMSPITDVDRWIPLSRNATTVMDRITAGEIFDALNLPAPARVGAS